ncbi:MAG: precorrin-8X methylmutase [Candidatus Odinarchaeota archaeon]
MNYEPVQPEAIEQESFRRIRQVVGEHGFPEEVWKVVRRIVHSTADLDFLENFRWHPLAVRAGVEALRNGRPVVSDTRMLLAGISTGRLARLGVEAHCLVADPEVAMMAREKNVTRSMAAMDRALPLMEGGIVAIGNAPTALFRVLELVARGEARPALIVGIPVGFVNAAESKDALVRSSVPYLTVLGPKGGSPVAASAVNALAQLALEETPS